MFSVFHLFIQVGPSHLKSSETPLRRYTSNNNNFGFTRLANDKAWHAMDDSIEKQTFEQPGPSRSEQESPIEPSQQEPSNVNKEPSTADTTSTTTVNNTVDIIREATDHALTFLSTASNETLIGCLVGLGAATYIVLGRVGLVLGGVVGGVYLHASWERASSGSQDDTTQSTTEVRKKEAGVEVVRRLLDWNKSKSGDVQDQLTEVSNLEDFSSLPPETAAALNTLADAIVKDYVKWWYSPLVPTDPSFPAACRSTLSSFLLSVSSRLARKRPAETFLDFVTHSSSIVVVFLNELSAVFTTCPNIPAEDAIYVYLRMYPDGNLANILDKEQQDRKLALVSDDILRSFLDKKAYQCAPVKAFLQGIVANLILEMTIQKCSKAAFLNEWIVCLLEDVEPQVANALNKTITHQSTGLQQPDLANRHRDTNGDDEQADIAQRKRAVSRAEEAMEEAMKEAQRLTQLMIEEDAKRARESQEVTRDSDETSRSGLSSLQSPASTQSSIVPADEARSKSFDSTGSAQSVPQEAMATPQAQAKVANLDQLSFTESPTAARRGAQVLTLHKARISIFDDSDPNDKRTLRNQPEDEYLIQVEPRSAQYPGWMYTRSYEDFLTLHEIVRRIAVISGLDFTESHASLPSWKNQNAAQLRSELEKYLADALTYQPIAESEGMKRFMDRNTAAAKSPQVANRNSGFWPNAAAFENMGKGMMDVLNNAPKVATGSGKAVFSGVTGAFGKIGPAGLKKASAMSMTAPPTPGKLPLVDERQSTEEKRSSLVFTEDGFISGSHGASTDDLTKDETSSRRSISSDDSRKLSAVPSIDERLARSRTSTPPPPLPQRPNIIELPPPPSEVTADYAPSATLARTLSPSRVDDFSAHMGFDGNSFTDVPTPSQPGTPAVERASFDVGTSTLR